MMTGVRNILWLLPLFLTVSWPVWGGYLVDFLRPRGSFESQPPSNSSGKTFTMDEVLFSQFKKGNQDWQIAANRLFSEPGSEDVLRMTAVDAVLFGKDDQRKFHIVSENGAYDMAAQVLTLADHVKVVSKEGYSISSRLLQYHDRPKEIRTSEPVQISTKNMEITGTGLRYNMTTGAYKVGGRVDFKVK